MMIRPLFSLKPVNYRVIVFEFHCGVLMEEEEGDMFTLQAALTRNRTTCCLTAVSGQPYCRPNPRRQSRKTHWDPRCLLWGIYLKHWLLFIIGRYLKHWLLIIMRRYLKHCLLIIMGRYPKQCLLIIMGRYLKHCHRHDKRALESEMRRLRHDDVVKSQTIFTLITIV